MNRRKFLKTSAITGAGLGFTGSLFTSKLFAGSGQVTLVRGGQSDWGIIAASPGSEVWFAAEELQAYLAQISRARLPVEDTDRRSSNIVVGLRGELAEEYRALLPPRQEGYDGYSITISMDPEVIVIAGDNGPGVIYGVYDFLEQLGCRWYQPTLDTKDPEMIPSLENISLPESSWSEAGQMEFRIFNGGTFFVDLNPEDMLPQLDWAAKNRYNGISWQPDHGKGKVASQMEDMKNSGILAEIDKRGLFLHGPAHSFTYFLQSDRYFEDHPEWFGFYKGERRPYEEFPNFCWSSEGAKREFIRNVAKYLDRYPQYKILCLVWTDGGSVCRCDDCQKRGAANLFIDLFNQFSKDLEKSKPDIMLESVIGYQELKEPPTEAVPNGKWQALYAHWGRNLNQSYEDSTYVRSSNLAEWSSYFKNNMQMCNYYATTSHQPVNAPPFLHALEGDMDYMVSNSIRGSFVMQYPPGFWWNFSFNMAEAGIYAYYYPKRKPHDQLRDYIYDYFGSQSAEILLPYFEKLAYNLNISYRASRGAATKSDMKWLAGTNEIIKQAQSAEKKQIYSYRIAKLAASHDMLMHWGDGLKYLENAEAKLAAYLEEEIDGEEVNKAITATRSYAEELLSHAAETERNYPGVAQADWLESWYVNRTLLHPLEDIEAKIN